jgi:hypothetical protein
MMRDSSPRNKFYRCLAPRKPNQAFDGCAEHLQKLQCDRHER